MLTLSSIGSNRHGSFGLMLASNRTDTWPAMAPGARSARWVVPLIPVTWQNKRYSGTDA